MTRLPLLLLLLLASILAGATVTAQDATTVVRAPTPTAPTDCPVGLACVEYKGVLLALDPSCGPVQALVVRENSTRTEDLITGVEEHFGLVGVVLVKQGDAFVVASEFSEPATGALAGVRYGATGCMAWEGDES